MIRTFALDNGRLSPGGELSAAADGVVWADLFAPTKEEEHLAERWLGEEIPTREEMEEIEASSRLYTEGTAQVMTVILPTQTDNDKPLMAPVTFVLAPGKLATIRYCEPKAFATFPQRAEKASVGCASAETVLISLLEAIVDRLADVLERVGREIMTLSHAIFHPTATNASKRDKDYQAMLRQIGRKEEIVSNMQESLLTFERLGGFLATALVEGKSDKLARARVKTLSRDIASLTEHAGFQSAKIGFLLDATLGMISIEQNAIIKIFSIAAVVLLPPTLVASVYGMNFAHMPELAWEWGYPAALGLMVAAAVLPYLFFKRKGWL